MRAARVCALALLVAFGRVGRAGAADEPQTAPALPAEVPAAAPLSAPASILDGHDSNGCPASHCLDLTFGERTWYSFGETSRSFSGFGGHPNVLSELKWHGLETVISEFNADAVIASRFVVHTDVGLGWTYGGQLRDDDYGGENRTDLISDSLTNANINGLGTFYVNAEFGYRVLQWDNCGLTSGCRGPTLTLDALAGYQYWEERDGSVGGVSLVPPFVLPDVPLIKEVFVRHNVRLGGRTSWRFLPRATLESRLMIVPWSYEEMTDTHFLRPDLAQPSARDQTQGGFGVMFDATVNYRIWRGLSVVVGYQMWEMTSGHGSTSEFFTMSSFKQVNLHLNEIDSFRQGVLIGLAYRF